MSHLTQTITIDPDAQARAIIDSWINGNRNEVIQALANDHAGLTALVLYMGFEENQLSVNDLRILINNLIDLRIEIVRS